MNLTPTPNPIETALEVLRADRQALIDCHTSGAGIPSDDELALQALAQYDQSIKGLESMLRKLQDLRQYDQAINGPQDLQAHFGTLPIRGVRVDDDTVVISAKGGNDAARWLCHWLLMAKEHRAAEAAAQPAGEPVARFCPGCGSVGPVPDSFSDCCPDGNKARIIPAKLAEHCRDLFQLAITSAVLSEEAPHTAARVPLTMEQIEPAFAAKVGEWEDSSDRDGYDRALAWFARGARWAADLEGGAA